MLVPAVSLWPLDTLLLVIPSAPNRRVLEAAGLLPTLGAIMKACLSGLHSLTTALGAQRGEAALKLPKQGAEWGRCCLCLTFMMLM